VSVADMCCEEGFASRRVGDDLGENGDLVIGVKVMGQSGT
jgi:hypothetical protein